LRLLEGDSLAGALVVGAGALVAGAGDFPAVCDALASDEVVLASAGALALFFGLLSLEVEGRGAVLAAFAVRADAPFPLASWSHAITSCLGSGSRGSGSGSTFGPDLDPEPKSLTTNVYLRGK